MKTINNDLSKRLYLIKDSLIQGSNIINGNDIVDMNNLAIEFINTNAVSDTLKQDIYTTLVISNILYNNTTKEKYIGFIALPTIGELLSGSDLFIQIQNNNGVSYLPNSSNQNSNQWLLTPHLNGNYVIGYNGFEKITNNNSSKAKNSK